MESMIRSNLWKKLITRYLITRETDLNTFFRNNKFRFEDFSIEFENILFDYSKNHFDDDVLPLLILLAEKSQLGLWISKLFNGAAINNTERRAVLHTALRNKTGNTVMLNGKNISDDINQELSKMKTICNSIHSGEYKGHTGKKIDTIVNIGIGGSHLGPEMVCTALKDYAEKGMSIHFVSNIDSRNLHDVLQEIDIEASIIIIASKTFTTQETMKNAEALKEYFIEKVGATGISEHFIGVSENIEACRSFGISEDKILKIWDWVGGRYSLWSSVGISIALYIGYNNFDSLLNGASKLDEHFRTTPLMDNIPVILALIDIWYTNFHQTTSRAVVPYDNHLRLFPKFLQQLEMESNGKSIKKDGSRVDTSTAPIIWGAEGTNSQHSFFQFLHQGTQKVPVDFIAICNTKNKKNRDLHHHDILLSNMIAQSRAMMVGRNETAALESLEETPEVFEEIPSLLHNKMFDGDRPSTTFLLKELTPETLGSLIAIYEHKVFVEGIIWGINSFDQWGVEIGKDIAEEVLSAIENDELTKNYDSSTNGLVNKYKKWKKDNN